METKNEMNDSCKAFQAFKPSTPIAKGIRVMAFNSTNTSIGTNIFLSLLLRPATIKHTRQPNGKLTLVFLQLILETLSLYL